MKMSFDMADLPSTLYSFVTYVVSIINSFLVVFGKDNEPYVIILISVVLGWFVKDWIKNSNNPSIWLVILSLLIYATLRWFSIGG